MIVVPCYNERPRLPVAAFMAFADAHPTIGFIFVDDGSTDGTAQMLRDLCHRAPFACRTLALERNVGKGEAVRRGVLEALATSAARYVGYWDADLATPLDAIPEFRAIQEASPDIALVMGARVQLLGRRVSRAAQRQWLGRVFATVAGTILALPVYDTQCGAKLFRVNALTRAVFAEPFCSRWIFDVEILARIRQWLRAHGQHGTSEAIYEVPLDEWTDRGGSKRLLVDYLHVARELCRIVQRYPMRLVEPAAPAVPAATSVDGSRNPPRAERTPSASSLAAAKYIASRCAP